MNSALTKEKSNKGIPKGIGILIGIAVAAVTLAIVLLHKNPNAVPKEEWIKKAIASAMVLVACDNALREALNSVAGI